MIVLCSVNDKQWHKGRCYCTTVGSMPSCYERLDVLAPTWELVKKYKYSGQDEQLYTDGYRRLLAGRWSQVKAWLDSLRTDEDITLMCFCREGWFCHRKLLAKMIEKWRPDLELVVH
jgi:Protein of unknown function, DUF488